jgi:hypothetical protein
MMAKEMREKTQFLELTGPPQLIESFERFLALTISLGKFRITKSLVHWREEALMTLLFFTVGKAVSYGTATVRRWGVPTVFDLSRGVEDNVCGRSILRMSPEASLIRY